MILKEKSATAPADKYGLAGHEAELQMAFYLRRAFGDVPDIFVVNDLRIERNGEFAQIDHLVFHRFGFVVVESKSVVGELTVNHRGEFARMWDGRPCGIPSPIQQARLQADLLSKQLNDNKEQLRRKVLFGTQQGYFGAERFRVVVAVSDRGVIRRDNCDPIELCKADSVADRVRAIIETHRHASSVAGFVGALVAKKERAQQLDKDQLPPYTDAEMANIQSFLLAADRPFAAKRNVYVDRPLLPASVPSPLEPKAVLVSTQTCRHCKGTDLAALHGRYGYYLKCNLCQGNTPIDLKCENCKAKARIQKAGAEFSRRCEACGTNRIVHVNASS